MSFIQITFYPTPWGFTIPVSILFSLFYLGSCIKLCFSSFRLFQLPFLNNHSHALLLFSSLPIPIIHSKSNFVYVKPRSFFPFLFFFSVISHAIHSVNRLNLFLILLYFRSFISPLLFWFYAEKLSFKTENNSTELFAYCNQSKHFPLRKGI